MSDQRESFGLLARTAASASALLEFEGAHGKATGFSAFDTLVGKILVRALAAEPVLLVERETRKDQVSILGLDQEDHERITESYAVERQQARGAWFLPEKVSLQTGTVNFAATFARAPRYASGIAREDRGRIVLADGPSAVCSNSTLKARKVAFSLKNPFRLIAETGSSSTWCAR